MSRLTPLSSEEELPTPVAAADVAAVTAPTSTSLLGTIVVPQL